MAAPWKRLWNLGITDAMPARQAKRILLANQFSLFTAFVPLLYALVFIRYPRVALLSVLATSAFVANFLVMAAGFTRLGRLLTFVLPSAFLVLVVSTLTDGHNPLELMPGKLILIGFSGVPLLLFDVRRERSFMVASYVLLLLLYLSFDWVAPAITDMAPGASQNIVARVYIASGVTFLFLFFSFHYFLRGNQRTEDSILNLLDEVSESNQNLRAREEDLRLKNNEVTEAYRELKATQTMMLHNEKMATLGQLVAGVAHEINTPLGAINAASQSLQRNMPAILNNYPDMLNGLDADARNMFFNLVDRTLANTRTFSSREERQYKKDLTQKLQDEKVEGAAEVAAYLVKSGLVDDVDSFLPIFKHPRRDEIFEMVATAGKVKLNLDNVTIAINKTQKIVQGLKSYSHMGIDEPEYVSLRENLETVLVIYHNQLKHGIDVTTEFEEGLPNVLCYPDELNQVWTNIITNAIQAMNKKGTLEISITRTGEHETVRVTDDGPGIPADVIDRIFQPFFTTKPKGEGTGLGLDISKKIVERHHGKIWVESVPGRTSFFVQLPINEKPDAGPLRMPKTAAMAAVDAEKTEKGDAEASEAAPVTVTE